MTGKLLGSSARAPCIAARTICRSGAKQGTAGHSGAQHACSSKDSCYGAPAPSLFTPPAPLSIAEYLLLWASFGVIMQLGLEMGIGAGIVMAALYFSYAYAKSQASSRGRAPACVGRWEGGDSAWHLVLPRGRPPQRSSPFHIQPPVPKT